MIGSSQKVQTSRTIDFDRRDPLPIVGRHKQTSHLGGSIDGHREPMCSRTSGLGRDREQFPVVWHALQSVGTS